MLQGVSGSGNCIVILTCGVFEKVMFMASKLSQEVSSILLGWWCCSFLRKTLTATLLCISHSLLPGQAIAEQNTGIPEYPWQEIPSCSLGWEADENPSLKIACNGVFQVLTENFRGEVFFYFHRVGDTLREFPGKRPVVAENVPERLMSFIQRLKSCSAPQLCGVQGEHSKTVEELKSIDLAADVWTIRPGVFGQLNPVYFFQIPSGLVAFHGVSGLIGRKGSVDIFPFAIIQLD